MNKQHHIQNKEDMHQMYNMMQNKTKDMIFNPKKENVMNKRAFVHENMTDARGGIYQQLKKTQSRSMPHVECDPGTLNNICEVKVIHEHALDVARMHADIGVQEFTENNGSRPAVLNVVGEGYTGDGFEPNDIRDEIMMIRTLFNTNIHKNIFPIKQNCCVYTPLVNVVRDKNPRMKHNFSNCYRTDIITATPIKQENNIRYMSSHDFLRTCTIIENVFQIAVFNKNKVLILTPFGHEEDNNPVPDIIQIFNFCIMRYGHKFRKIYIAVPPHYPPHVYDIYKEKILKPNEIAEEIDVKYENILMQQQIQNRFAQDDSDSEIDRDDSCSNSSSCVIDKSGMNMNDQYQMFMELAKKNPEMFNAMKQKKIGKEKRK